MDRTQEGKTFAAMSAYTAVLAQQFAFAAKLGSQARQASAERAWHAVQRFYDNCQQQKPGKKGYPQFKHDCRSIEYKVAGWKLEPDGRHITLRLGTEGPLPLRREFHPHVRWLNQESAAVFAQAECQKHPTQCVGIELLKGAESMAQVTINLPDELYEALKRFAEALGKPVEDVVSEWVQGPHETGVGPATEDLDEFFRELERA